MVQQLADACQENFQQMSNNDRVLIDIAVTNQVNTRAVMSYLERQGADLKPFIDDELKRREEEGQKMRAQAEEAKELAQEEIKKGAPPEPPSDEPLIFGGVSPDANPSPLD